ncbi:hypothetical protein LTR95_001418 [Oleoguttula sp. CCFEE 5521]
MARTRRAKPELTESWDAVDEQDDFEGGIYSDEDERQELGSQYRENRHARSRRDDDDVTSEASKNAMRNSRTSGRREEEIKPRKRGARQEDGPELVMPSSPDAKAAARARAGTPHFRLNQRSLTSDAGSFNRRVEQDRIGPSRLKKMAAQMEAKYDEQIDDSSDLNWPITIWSKVVRPLLGYVLEIARIAVTNPITKGLFALWLIIGVFTLGSNFVNDTINNALSPLCRVPGVSLLSLPFCPSHKIPELSGPAEFDKLVDAQSHFEDVLSATAGGAFLPLEMKHSEASIRDLKHVVQYSTLPSRHELVFEFSGFIDTARQASQDLSKFNSRIGRAVDQILSTNRWTLQVIDGVAEKDAHIGSVQRWVSNNLNIFAPFQPVALSRDVLLDQYLRHTSAVEDQILGLISEAQALLAVLDNLDSRLDVIAGIATRDDIRVQGNKEELFANLWVKLGGRRNSVAKIDKQLGLLKEVGSYRRMAWAHVNGAIIKLMAIRDSLEDLRERVAMPEVIGEKVPLEVHIRNIELGIERLEEQRDNSRRLQQQQVDRLVSRAEEGREIGGREI